MKLRLLICNLDLSNRQEHKLTKLRNDAKNTRTTTSKTLEKAKESKSKTFDTHPHHAAYLNMFSSWHASMLIA